jgi:hypothetical protein
LVYKKCKIFQKFLCTYSFFNAGSSKTRHQKAAEIERRSKLMSGKAHPPPWLSNDEKLEEYLHNFMLSIQGNDEFLSNQK